MVAHNALMDLAKRLSEIGYVLPQPAKAVASYVPAVRTGNLVVVSGQLPLKEGKLLATGAVPTQTAIEGAQAAAGQCVVNALAALGTVIDGDYSLLRRVVRVGVFVQSAPGFSEQHVVANGASDLVVSALGPQIGAHARAAVGVPGLPLDAAVEVECLFEVA